MIIQGHEVIARILVGSRAYGTDIEGSDWDYKGVFIQDPLHLFLNGPIKIIEISEDEIYYELGYFAGLCLHQNPTILEMLYAPEDCVEYTTEHWRRFQNKRHLVLAKKARHAYKGYISKELKELTRGPKQAAHIYRLYFTALTVAKYAEVRLRLSPSTLAFVKDMRQAVYIDRDAIRSAERPMMEEIDAAFAASTLPDEPDTEKIMEKVLDIKKEYFKQYDNTRRYSEDIKAPDVR